MILSSELQMKLLFNVSQLDQNLEANIDATGKIVKHPKNVRNWIYYYAVVISVENTHGDPKNIIPILEMVSSKHKVLAIGDWLRTFKYTYSEKYSNWPPIKHIVTDFSFANINSILETWNLMDLKSYMNLCHSMACRKTEKINISYIHLCCTHLIKNMINDIASFYGKKKLNIKQNIIKLGAKIFNITNYEDAKQYI